MFTQIVKGELVFPSDKEASDEFKDFVCGLLAKNPEDRLSDSILEHVWFRNIDFNKLYGKVYKTLKPCLDSVPECTWDLQTDFF